MSSIEQIHLELPPLPPTKSLLSRVPKTVTALVFFAFALYLWSRLSSTKKRGPRREAVRPPTTVPRPVNNSAASSRAKQIRTSSPQLTRRSSAVWGPQGRGLVQSNSYPQSSGTPSGSVRNSPLKSAYSSARRASGVPIVNSGYARSSVTREQPTETGRYEPESYSRPSQAYAAGVPASLGRPPRPSFVRPSPSQPTSTQSVSNARSSMPRRRYTEGTASLPSATGPTRKRQHDDEDRDDGKRFKQHTDVDSEDEEGMDYDEEERWSAPPVQSRGTKRSNRDDDRTSKRSRGNQEQSEEPSDDYMNETNENGAAPRKRRAHSDDDSDEEYRPDSHHGQKRAKAGASSKPGSKRDFDDVDASSEEFSESEPERGPRNADSDVGSEDEEEAVTTDDASSTVRSEGGKSRKGGKRARDTSGRRGSNDLDVMDGMMDDDTLAASNTGPSKGRATLPKKSKGRSGKKRGSVARKVGEEWFNHEGDRLRIDKDGMQRKLCEVREMRRKFKMPKDSTHPDRDIMHEVIAEKWLTQEENARYVKEGKMAWQPSLVAEVVPVKTEEVLLDTASRPTPKKVSGIFYQTGTGTPLRSHSNLARPSPARPSSTPLSLAHRSTSQATLINGRLRLPSGSAVASPVRSWSHGKASRMLEDEQLAKMERERKRKASIALGGEAERSVELDVAAVGAPKEKALSPRPQESLKLSSFGAPPPAATPSAPPAEPPSGSSSLFSLGKTTSVSAPPAAIPAAVKPAANLFAPTNPP
ncbi:hypothetical protein P7C70_g5259, partial [Phenoliferia sp. Uapishka_3]